MSIRENVHVSEKFGCIEVIEQFERHERTNIVANHALYFMGHIMFITDQMHACIMQ
jgi:hypothetical protein